LQPESEAEVELVERTETIAAAVRIHAEKGEKVLGVADRLLPIQLANTAKGTQVVRSRVALQFWNIFLNI